MKRTTFILAALLFASLFSCDLDTDSDEWFGPEPPPPPGLPGFTFQMDGEFYEASNMRVTTGMEQNEGLPIFFATCVSQHGALGELKMIVWNDVSADGHRSDSVEVICTYPSQPEKSFHLISKNGSFQLTWMIVQPGYMSGTFSGELHAVPGERVDEDAVSFENGVFENVEM